MLISGIALVDSKSPKVVPFNESLALPVVTCVIAGPTRTAAVNVESAPHLTSGPPGSAAPQTFKKTCALPAVTVVRVGSITPKYFVPVRDSTARRLRNVSPLLPPSASPEAATRNSIGTPRSVAPELESVKS